ncbi:Protein IQ-DOMAIN 1 [Platanthera guangdongensis]|uniref:Protein IQ-DOMAIN 1 n=1 Tax=Platanthera guangdongensis TaxID=2320717 RepID=A0ABR2M1M6_9ASPA
MVGLRGMVRLKLMANRNAVKRQMVSTLHRMQSLARIQSQIRERRIRLSEENQTLHRQKEQFEAKLQKKQEAALRRERTLAYAYSHQWNNKSTRSKKPSFIDPANPDWGWSWLERWMATRPWEINRTITDRNRSSGLYSIKSDVRSIAAFRRSSTKSRPSPSTPTSISSNDDIPNLPGLKTAQIRRRRHSIAGAFCFRDEESPRAKSLFQGTDSGKLKFINGGSLSQKQLTLSVFGENKKTIPALASATRRLSGSPKVASYGE